MEPGFNKLPFSSTTFKSTLVPFSFILIVLPLKSLFSTLMFLLVSNITFLSSSDLSTWNFTKSSVDTHPATGPPI